MGLNADLFVSDEEGYVCAICHDVAHPPVLFPCPGQHIFCRPCIKQWIRLRLPDPCLCPQCQTGMQGDLIPLSPFVERQYNNLTLRCSQKCNLWEGSLGDMAAHHASDCSQTLVPCPNEGCALPRKRGDLQVHAQTECPYRMVPCKHCKGTFAANTLDDHDSVCPRKLVSCPDSMGAPSSSASSLTPDKCKDVARGDLESHSLLCPWKQINCLWSENGCTFKVCRHAMPHHENTEVGHHMRLMQAEILSLKQQLAFMKNGPAEDSFQHRIPASQALVLDVYSSKFIMNTTFTLNVSAVEGQVNIFVWFENSTSIPGAWFNVKVTMTHQQLTKSVSREGSNSFNFRNKGSYYYTGYKFSNFIEEARLRELVSNGNLDIRVDVKKL